MPTIKNVGTHLDVLDDGRPLPVEAVVDITDEQFALDHYQSRLADGTLIETDPVAPSGAPVDGYDDLKVDEVQRLLDVAAPDHFAEIKAYEAAHKDRSSIRDYVAQAPTPTPEEQA